MLRTRVTVTGIEIYRRVSRIIGFHTTKRVITRRSVKLPPKRASWKTNVSYNGEWKPVGLLIKCGALCLIMQANHSFTRRQAVLTGMSGTKLWTTGKGTLSGSKDRHDCFSLGSWSKSPTLQMEPPFVFLSRKIKRGSAWVLNRVKPLKSPKPELRFCWSQSCSLSSNWSSECEHPFIDKTMVITPDARPLGLGSKHYPRKKRHMFSKDLSGFVESLSRVRQNRSVKEKLC